MSREVSNTSKALLGLVFLFGSIQVGCGTTVAVKGWEPSEISTGRAQHIVVTESVGREHARDFVVRSLVTAAEETGYYSIEDQARPDGAHLNFPADGPKIEGYAVSKKGNELFLRTDILQWAGDHEVEHVRTRLNQRSANGRLLTNNNSAFRTRERMMTFGRVVIRASLVDSAGNTIFVSRDFAGASRDVSAPGFLTDDAIIEAAAKDAVNKLLRSITPALVTQKIDLDTSDSSQGAAINLAEEGDLKGAEAELQRYLDDKSVDNASVRFNLAVIKDALGQYEEALELYDEALERDAKPEYRKARDGCSDRWSDSKIIFGTDAPGAADLLN